MRPTSSSIVAAPDVHHYHDHSHYHGPFAYEYNPVSSGVLSDKSFQCPRSWTRDLERHRREDYMSDRPAEQGQSGFPARDASHEAGSRQTWSPRPNTAVRPTSSVQAESMTSPNERRTSESSTRGFELPPLPSTSSGAGGRFLPSMTRLGDVSSILNPPQSEETHENRRRKASQLESPASSTQSLPPIFFGPHASQPPSMMPTQSPVFQHTTTVERPPRRILTPRSPSLHRAASLGQLNPPAGTISAQANPFPTSPRGRMYTVEPGTSGAPPLPTPPAGGRPGYGFSAPTPPIEAVRRASTGAPRARAPSASASPSTSYSSYSQTGQTSPAMQHDPMSLSTLSAPYTTNGELPMSGSGTASAPPTTLGPGRQRQMGIPISSSGGQNVYQMLTLETTAGTVQLPVDVQAASRVADEKRRRNAGASARFRQRRKEKEKEATTSIARLEQQVKELGEDAEFYRRERDFLAGVLSHIPGGERHFPRPNSPRHRRQSAAQLPAHEGSGYTSTQDQGSGSPAESRNVRRRTSTFSLPPPPQQQSMQGSGIAIQPNFGHAGTHPPPSSLQSPSGPLPSPLSRAPLPLPPHLPPGPAHQQSLSHPPQLLHAMPQTGPYNPYAPDRRPSGPSSQQRDGR